MEIYFSNSKNTFTVLFNKFKFVSTGLFECNNSFAGNFVIHFISFKHKSSAVISIG